MVTIEQVKDYQTRTTTLATYLHIEDLRVELQELKLRAADPALWQNVKQAEVATKQLKKVESLVSDFDLLSSTIEELQLAFDYQKEGILTDQEVDSVFAIATDRLDNLELRQMLSDDADVMPCVVKIVAGAGGTEAQDWAQMLMRMYIRYCERKGYSVSIQSMQSGDEAGVKSVVFNVEGEMAYGYLKTESGVHRLVRVSPFNAQGKRMTSFASVFVIPLVDDNIEVDVDMSKVTWDTFRSSGAGGQNVNKVESGVRLHYSFYNKLTGQPDEIVIENTETRDQPKNRQNALRLLKSQLYNIEMEYRNRLQAEQEKGKKKIEWGSQIRSYVFDDRRVKDHRTNFQTSDVQSVMDGNLDPFIRQTLLLTTNN